MVIKATGLTKVFYDADNRITALNDVNLRILPDEMKVLLGPSGSGKTTLLNLLSTLDNPTKGEVFLDDTPVSELNDRQKSLTRNKSFGFIFQFFNLLPEFSVLENVMIPALIRKANRKPAAIKNEAQNLLDKLGMGDRREAMPAELSGGEKQRAAVARALINQPAVVFADEPTGNLDQQNTDACLRLFQQIKEEAKTSFLIATHNPMVASFLNASVLRLENGKIIG